jgi:hypothetical protein
MRKISMPIKPYPHGSAPMFEARRRAKGPVYAIAFGLGLAIWFLLPRNLIFPTAPAIRASGTTTHRTAVASHTMVTVTGLQDLQPIETLRGQSTGRVRPVPDILQDATVIVRTPHVGTDSAHSSEEPARRTASHRIQARPHETTSMSTRAQYDPATAGPSHLRRQSLPYPSIPHRQVDRPASHGPN